jgi:hypothetical protein
MGMLGFFTSPLSILLVPTLTEAPDVGRRVAATVGIGAVVYVLARMHVSVLVTVVAAFVSYVLFATLLREGEAVGYWRLAMRTVQRAVHTRKGHGGHRAGG